LIGIIAFVELVVNYAGISEVAHALLTAVFSSGIIAFVLLVVNIQECNFKEHAKGSPYCSFFYFTHSRFI